MSFKPCTINKIFTGMTQLLNEKHQNDYKVNSFSISSPCSAGENFLSEIYSMTVEVHTNNNCLPEYTIELYNYIAKSQILDPDNPNDVRRYVFHLIFTKERLMYSTVLEEMKRLLLTVGLAPQHASLSPTMHHFYSEEEAYSCMFLDNLTSLGYYIPQTHGEGITLDECNSVMKAIARFHATSLVIEGQKEIPLNEALEICAAEFFLSDHTADSMMPVVMGSYEGIIQLAEKFRPDLALLLKDLHDKESIWNRLCALVKPGTTSFSCLCHGDPRLNNVFISKKDESTARFIDFQLTRYASPLTDLHYILYMGSTKEFREKHTEQVLATYFTEFTSVLNQFPSEKLLPLQEKAVNEWTREKMLEEYEDMTMYGFLIALTLLPIVLLRPGDIDKSVGQMSKDERERFWSKGRKAMVFELGCKHEDVRKRLFDVCDEAFAKIKI